MQIHFAKDFNQNPRISSGIIDIGALEKYYIGINNFNLGKINIYPTPTTGNFAIEVSKKYSLTIFDATGKTIITQEVEIGKTELNMTNQKDGIYFVRLTNDKEVQNLRIVKE